MNLQSLNSVVNSLKTLNHCLSAFMSHAPSEGSCGLNKMSGISYHLYFCKL